jgi:hypothetical protein
MLNPDPAFQVNLDTNPDTDPEPALDPGFRCPQMEKKIQLKIYFFF